MYEQSGGGVWCESTSALYKLYPHGQLGLRLWRRGLQRHAEQLHADGQLADSGGGASDGMLNNCTLTGNSAISYGGGAYEGTLNNCTLTGNSADLWRRGLLWHAQQLHADRQLGLRNGGGAAYWHAQQLHADGQLGRPMAAGLTDARSTTARSRAIRPCVWRRGLLAARSTTASSITTRAVSDPNYSRRHAQLLLHHPTAHQAAPATSPPSRNWPAPPTSAPVRPAAGRQRRLRHRPGH